MKQIKHIENFNIEKIKQWSSQRLYKIDMMLKEVVVTEKY